MRIDVAGVVSVFGSLLLAAYCARQVAGSWWAAGLVMMLAAWKMAWDSRRED